MGTPGTFRQPHVIAENYSVSSGSYIRQTKPLDLNDKVRVCKAEETKTYVNIAINILMDAVDGKSEHFEESVHSGQGNR